MKMNRVFESQLHYWTHMLDEAFPDEAMLAEGKHWPEDYIKAAVNKLKAAGKYDGEKTDADVVDIAQRFKPKFHTNSALGYFNSVVRWYSEDPEDFIKPKNADGSQPEDQLEMSLNFLKQFLNTQDLVQKDGEKVKQSMSLEDFSTMMKKISDEDAKNAADVKFKVEDKGYNIIPFMSYEELNSKFGGDKTGYNGRSEWCHTNGQSTYDSWTENYTKFFFVIAKDGWEKIKPKENPKEDDNAYDEYGLSLMAILVSGKGQLLKCTLRWNHVIEPKYTKPGREVDGAFISFAELSQVTGLDVEAEVKKELSALLEKTKDIPRGKKVYEGPEGICFASDRLQWYDKDFKKIDPPKEIRGNFYCNSTSITSLEGCPRIVRRGFYCAGTKITSLKGCPREVGGSFDCSDTKITSLEGCPNEVENFYCVSTPITSLEGCPQIVKGNFDCSFTRLSSLKGAPKIVEGNFDCSYVDLDSLEGGPRLVGGNFKCNTTHITTLEGAPRKVYGYFDCQNTKLKSLKGAPAKIGNTNNTKFPEGPAIDAQIEKYSKWMKTKPKDTYPGD